MDIYKGLGFVALIIVWCIFLWGVAGWWRYWRAVQAAAEARRLYGAQIEQLWLMLDGRAWSDRLAAEAKKGRAE